MRKLIAILLVLSACGFDAGGDASAQALSKFWFNSDLCTGNGVSNSPFTCALTTDSTIDGTGSAGSPISVGGAIAGMTFGVFGDGYMGDCHITVNTVQVGDLYCHDMTIDAGVWLFMSGYRLFVTGTLYLNGAVGNWGADGAAGVNGTTAVAACASATGGSRSNAVLPAGSAGGNGAATPATGTAITSSLGATDSAGLGGAASTTTGNNGTTPSTLHRGGGGASGGGFGGTASTVGGTGGATTASSGTARRGPYGDVWWGARGRSHHIASNTFFSAGSGGGGGSCGKATVQATHKVPGGGAGGSGGSWNFVAAREVVYGLASVNGFVGAFWAWGGTGGAGGSCGTHDGDATGGGGGGGGGGGVNFLVLGTSDSLPDATQTLVYGGPGGAGGIGCVGGVNGGTGGTGGSGETIIYQVSL